MIKYEFALPDQDQLFQLYENDGWNEFLKLPKENCIRRWSRAGW